MAFASEFIPVELKDLRREAAMKKAEGWRFIQTHAANGEDGVDLYYSFMKDGAVGNLCVRGVKKGQAVPSITDMFLAAFVFENEARELFGVDMHDIAIDFAGAMYAPAESEPMTFISPEQKAAREKAKKDAEARQEKKEGSESETGAAAQGGFVMTPERRARLEAKLATMSPEKVAKVEAALKAREAEAASRAAAADAPEKAEAAEKVETPDDDSTQPTNAQVTEGAKDTALDDKLSAMDPAKAEKVRAALAGKTPDAKASAVAASQQSEDEPQALREADEQLKQLIGLMDDAKAQVVRKALNMKEGE